MAWAVGVTVTLAVGVVSLSDRAPLITESLLYRGRAGYRRIERRSGHDFIDRTDIPFAWDVVAHFFLWGGVGFVAYWLARRRLNPLVVAAGLIAVSGAVEIAQVRLSSTRLAQTTDFAANATGVVLGVAAAFIVGLIIDGRRRSTTRSD